VRTIQPRIDIVRLLRLLIGLLIAPVSSALLLDIMLGWMPWLTIITIVVFIPLATVFLIRAILDEFQKVVQMIAPESVEATVEALEQGGSVQPMMKQGES
jgi:hypothetical protein